MATKQKSWGEWVRIVNATANVVLFLFFLKQVVFICVEKSCITWIWILNNT